MADIVRRSVGETIREANRRWIRSYQPEGAHSFPPGNNANPGGRPKRKPITEAYQIRLDGKLPAALRKVRVGRATVTLPEGATFLDWVSRGQCIEAGLGKPRSGSRDCRPP